MKKRCPICAKPPVQEFTPFCSERCKLRDLGHWVSGTYAIPTQEPAEDNDNMPEEEP